MDCSSGVLHFAFIAFACTFTCRLDRVCDLYNDKDELDEMCFNDSISEGSNNVEVSKYKVSAWYSNVLLPKAG